MGRRARPLASRALRAPPCDPTRRCRPLRVSPRGGKACVAPPAGTPRARGAGEPAAPAALTPDGPARGHGEAPAAGPRAPRGRRAAGRPPPPAAASRSPPPPVVREWPARLHEPRTPVRTRAHRQRRTEAFRRQGWGGTRGGGGGRLANRQSTAPPVPTARVRPPERIGSSPHPRKLR